MEPATYRFVAQCLNELRYRVTHFVEVKEKTDALDVSFFMTN
jgi:hypothetical protein